jgi:hypothetical protein
MSTQPLTPAELAAAEALAAFYPPSYTAATFEPWARAVVAAVQPVLLAEFYDAMAGATEECGPMSAEGFRGLALMARQSLSRPTSEEH